MKKTILATAAVSLIAFGFLVTRNQKPEAIKGLSGVERDFEWVDPQTDDTIYDIAWEFTPEQTEELRPFIDGCDTSWVYKDGGNTFIVYWNPDVTVQSGYNEKGLVNHWVYKSESFE